MITLEYTIIIDATPEKIWTCLWEEENYRTWTKIFTPESHYKTDSFTEGSKIHLKDGSGGGMFSVIDRLVANKYLAFRHMGLLKNHVEQPIDEETAQWSGSLETYELLPEDGKIKLVAQVETFESYVDSMNRSFPGALEIVKNLAEKK